LVIRPVILLCYERRKEENEMKKKETKIVGSFRAKGSLLKLAKKKSKKTDASFSETIERLLQEFVEPIENKV